MSSNLLTNKFKSKNKKQAGAIKLSQKKKGNIDTKPTSNFMKRFNE